MNLFDSSDGIGGNCSTNLVSLLWYNHTGDMAPVVTNTTIEAKVLLPGFAVLGVRFRRPSLLLTVIGYSLVNVIATSVIPMPIATSLVPLATILFGFLSGMIINVSSTCVGAYLGLLLVRYACRPCFVRALGRHQQRWRALDKALAADGWQISLLIRCSPVSPVVITNILLSLTSISQLSYTWTVFVGEVVTSFPYAYATHIGATLVSSEQRVQDPLMLFVSFVGLAASVAIAWKVGVVAKAVLQEHTDLDYDAYDKL